MKVTVLLAVHDGGEYLRGAVEDTLAQTYGDLELLVVDDASGDGSAELVESYADPRIRVLRNERNLGQAPSLNRGLAAARGEYVARIDHDDRMLPTRVERQVEVLDADPAVALVGTWIDVIDEDDRLWATIRGDVRDAVDLAGAVLVDDYPFGHPSLMYRRDVVLALGGYDESLAPSEDKDLYRRLALAGHGVRVVREPLVRYRRHEQQLSQQRHELQLRTDHEGQERFLAELAGSELAPALRRLLAGEPADDVVPAEALDALFDGAARRLRLSAEQRLRLERRVAAHLTRRALRLGPPGRDLLVWTAGRDRRARWVRPLLPVVVRARRATRPLRQAARAPLLTPVRRRARRVRWLRSIYTRLG